MSLAEMLTLLAVIVSLLALIAQVVHITFDIVWRISHDNNDDSKKK